MGQKWIFTLLMLAALWMVVHGQKTNRCYGKYKKYKPCGNHKCCCLQEKAVCQYFGRTLKYIPPLLNVSDLTFRFNFLPSLKKESFVNITASSNDFTLTISSNKIVNISEDAFSPFSNLQTLWLDGNHHIDPKKLSVAFGSIRSSSTFKLRLGNIGLEELPDNFFSNLTSANVTLIDMTYNNMEVFNAKAFQNLSILKYIYLQNNKLREISRVAVLTSLEHIDFSNNEFIGEIPRFYFCLKIDRKAMFPYLRTLYLFNNFISMVGKDAFKCLNTLEKLGLSGNVLKVVVNNAFAELGNLRVLQLAYMHRSMKAIKKYAFNNSHMTHLNFRENYMVFNPETDKFIFQNSTNLRDLDISLTNLKRFSPDDVLDMLSPLKKLETIHAERCQIIRLSENFLETLQSLKHLILDGNSIHTLGTPFKNVFGLRRLSLQGNAFNVIGEKDVSGNFMTSIEEINLSNNPFACTCALLWFRLKTNSKTGKFGNITLTNWPKRYECLTPQKLMHTRIIDYNPTKLSCTNLVQIAMICLATILVLASVISVVSYRYRWYIRYWFYKLKAHRKEPENRPLLEAERPRYDGYVIYNSNDGQFVHHELRLFMENKHHYKLHIWERDAPGAGSTLEAMVDGIYASEHVIAVISKHSLRDSWVQFQMDVALDRQVELNKDFLILVILEDFDFKKLSKYWCIMLTRLRSASWCPEETDVKYIVFQQQMTRHFGRVKTQNDQ